MGKGSGRRPASVTEKEYEDNHARIFPPKPKPAPPPEEPEKP